MHKYSIFLVTLFLTACTSSAYYATPRAPDAALVQAQADATQQALLRNAQATATREAQALRATQTAVVRDVAADAGHKIETQVALSQTQVAMVATAVWVQGVVMSATAQALIMPLEFNARATEIAADTKQGVDNYQRGMVGGWAFVVSLFVCTALLVWYLMRLLRSNVRRHEAETEIRRADAAREWKRTHAWGEEFPLLIAPPAEVVTDDSTRLNNWAKNMRVFFREGDRRSFSIREMSTEPKQGGQVIAWDAWGVVTKFYKSSAGGHVLQHKEGLGTVWGDDYNLATVLQKINAGALPYPEGDAPECCVSPNTTTRTTPQHSPNTINDGSEVLLCPESDDNK